MTVSDIGKGRPPRRRDTPVTGTLKGGKYDGMDQFQQRYIALKNAYGQSAGDSASTFDAVPPNYRVVNCKLAETENEKVHFY